MPVPLVMFGRLLLCLRLFRICFLMLRTRICMLIAVFVPIPCVVSEHLQNR